MTPLLQGVLIALLIAIVIGPVIFVSIRFSDELVGVARSVRDWWKETYGDELARARHACEEDARRLGALKLPEWPE